MTQQRSVLAVRPTDEELLGNLETRNVLGEPIERSLDPFLILGHHGPQLFGPNNNGMPFRDHPHRGFETVTFVLEGSLVHSDSGGQNRVIGKGGVQWMTAGSGVVHNEQVPPDFLRTGGVLEILQLWVNLPARLKMTAPRYIGVQADAVPIVKIGSGSLHLVSGRIGGVTGPIESLTDIFMSLVELPARAPIGLPAPRGRTVLLYIVRGEISVGERRAAGGDLVKFADDGGEIQISSPVGAVMLFGHADPIGEPVVSRGPFVMNTEEEIDQAYRDYRAGAFGQPPASIEVG